MIIGKKILHYKEIDSTNEEARRLIKQGEGEGLVVVAERQTKGRGKPGAGWFSPRGGLYLSAVVNPRKNQKALAPITLLGALAARSMIAGMIKLPAVIKWPNDLLIHGKKAGGVLTERVPSGHVIIGIGVNINNDRKSFPGELKETATSLMIEARRKTAIKTCVAALLHALDREYLAYLSKV